MLFQQRFEVSAIHHADQEIALAGKEASSGRPVVIYLLTRGTREENQAVARKAAELPPAQRQHVLATGDHEGIPYVVTDGAAGATPLRTWLASAAPPVETPAAPTGSPAGPAGAPSEDFARVFQFGQTTPAGSEPGEFTRMVRGPGMQGEKPPAPPVKPALPDEKEPGEFTRMVQTPWKSPEGGGAPPEVKPQAPPASPAEPGEFTRLFQTPPKPTPTSTSPGAAAPPATSVPQPRPEAPAPAPSTRPPAPTPAPTAEAPGEFTRMLQSPLAPKAGAEPVAPAAPSPQPPSELPHKAPAPPPTPQPTGDAPGEFTRMLRSPLAPKAGAEPVMPAGPSSQPASEFTRIMQSGSGFPPPAAGTDPFQVPARPPEPARPPGEFTRMFSAPPAAERGTPPAPTVPIASEGAATGLFSARPAPPTTPASEGPSEFTRMFSAPPAVKPAAPPAIPQPGVSAVAAKAAAPIARAKKSVLPLILGLGVLLLAAVVLIAVFALKH